MMVFYCVEKFCEQFDRGDLEGTFDLLGERKELSNNRMQETLVRICKER